MADYIISTEKFKEHLSGWLFKNEQAHANFLYLNKEKIPAVFRNTKLKLYRGMKVSLDVIDILEAGKFVTKKHTSWSKSEDVAKKFIDDPAFAISDNKSDKLVKILLVKTMPSGKQILDIDAFVTFMGIPQLELMGYDESDLDSAIKEKEVLIAKEIKILRNEYKILK